MFFQPDDLRLMMSILTFGLGLVFVLAGLYKLLATDLRPAAKSLAVQAAKLGRKALADDIGYLVESTARLADAVNQLVLTSAGVGVLLELIGGAFMAAAYFILP